MNTARLFGRSPAAEERDALGRGRKSADARYGVLRPDTGGMTPRFCGGRPGSATTEDVLGWGCRGLAAEGERVFVVVWGNAAWHASERVGRWVARHNRRGRRDGGCRIRACGRPRTAPWLDPIEPEGGHGKRAVAGSGR